MVFTYQFNAFQFFKFNSTLKVSDIEYQIQTYVGVM